MTDLTFDDQSCGIDYGGQTYFPPLQVYEVIALLARHPLRVRPLVEIADAVCPAAENFDLGARKAVMRARRYLAAIGAPPHIVTRHGIGYYWEPKE